MDRKTKRRARVLVGFLIVMSVCTVLSRAAASVLVAQVQVEKPGRGKLSYSCGGSGTVVPVQEKTIFLWADQQVEWAAETGSTVKAGDCLIQFRMEHLQRAIQNKQAELAQLEIQIQQQQISARGTARVPTAERALQNLKDAKEKLQEAQEKEAKAQEEYEQFGGSAWTGLSSGRSGTISGRSDNGAEGGQTGSFGDASGSQPVTSGGTPGGSQPGTSGGSSGSDRPGNSDDTSGSDRPGTSGGSSGSDRPGNSDDTSGSNHPGNSDDTSGGQPGGDTPGTPGGATDGDRPGTSDDDPGAIFPDDSSNMSSREQELKAALQQAQADVEAARQAVAQAQTDYTFAQKEDSAQSTNEANAVQSAQLGAQSLNVQADTARRALEELTAYQNAGGKICAEQECTVLMSSVQTGTFTTGAEVMVTGSGGWKLKGYADAKDKEKLKAGAEAEIRLGAGKKKTVRIESIAAERAAGSENGAGESGSSSQSLQFCWYARLPENTAAENGNAFSWNVNSSSDQEYEQLIPLTALREDSTGAYCLILSEEKNMLGRVQTARRVPVTVLEKDAQKAAVTSTLQGTDQIIVSSEKYVEEGDRVRIKE
ncbi:hypothetical protein [Schaedlerella arabinosiphila]|uniref:hypothetical protein n=1 Tax=Schaedlerella arabinosiphila TaxID=2044587 RepID=UPI002557D035|nr:hypothetical protein [Schaedlerella arabinosiphila]